MLQAYRRSRYRTRQFLRALGERPDAQTRRLAATYLDDRSAALFFEQTPRDQGHAARTATWLLACGAERELIVAGLLHDIGKGRQRLWQRVAYVLLAACGPQTLARVARPGDGWRGALDRSRRHAELGARLARSAGQPYAIAELIAGHHRPPASAEAALLQAADERA